MSQLANRTCPHCCRILRWYKNPREKNPNVYQAVCCHVPYYEELPPLSLPCAICGYEECHCGKEGSDFDMNQEQLPSRA